MKKSLVLLATMVIAFTWTGGGRAQTSFSFKHLQFYGAYNAYTKIPPNDLGFNDLPELENSANLVTWGYFDDDHITQLFSDRLKAAKIKVNIQLYLADKPGVFFDQPAGTRTTYLNALKNQLNLTGMMSQVAFIAPYEEWFTRNSHDEFDWWPQFAGMTDEQQHQLIADTLPALIAAIKATFPSTPTLLVENQWNLTNRPAPSNLDVLGIDAYFTPPSESCDQNHKSIFDNLVTSLYQTARTSYPGRPIMMVPGAFVWAHAGYAMPSVCQLAWYREVAEFPEIIGMQWYLYRSANEPGEQTFQQGFREFPPQRDEILRMGRQIVNRYRHQILWRSPNGDIRKWDLEDKTRILESNLSPPTIIPEWHIVGTGDFNQDAHQDIVWQYRGSGLPGTQIGALYVWLMDREQMSQSVPVGPGVRADLTWNVRAVTDIDNDGDPDLVWQNDDGRIAAWVMNGLALQSDSLFSPSQSVPTAWKIVGAGDVDGNGSYNIIWHNQITGQASSWDMQGLNQLSGSSLIPDGVPDTNWKLSGVTDVNGDGKADLVWHYVHPTNENDTNARLVSHWIMNGLMNTDGSLYNPPRIDTGGWRITGIR